MGDVLVVEDDRVVRQAVAGLCRSEGLRVDEAPSAEAALARLARTSYRLTLVDLMLPERSGFDVLRDLPGGHRPSAVVTFSGYATIDNALRSLRLGAFDFLAKPFDVPELLGVLRRALRYGERRTAAPPAGEAAAPRRLFLGRHSWAALDADGVATVGAAETFPGGLGNVARIELPAIGDRLAQGQQVARLTGPEEVHRIWSPLGGLVVAVNARLAGAVELLDRSPFDSGWLARIVPADFENERRELVDRLAYGDSASRGG